jgi:hypothetical protein
MGKDEASMDELRDAKQRVALAESVMKLPYIKATRNASTGQERFVARDDVITAIHEYAKQCRESAQQDSLPGSIPRQSVGDAQPSGHASPMVAGETCTGAKNPDRCSPESSPSAPVPAEGAQASFGDWWENYGKHFNDREILAVKAFEAGRAARLFIKNSP